MKSKYTFWIFISFLAAFILWWYYYAFTTLNTRYGEDTPNSATERGEPPEVEIKNPEPEEVGEALTDTITYTINASSLEEWAYFDFSTGTIVKEPGQFSLEWDLGFKRALLISNGGEANPKGMGGVVRVENAEIDSIKEAPESDYSVDIRVNPTETENPAFKKWYEYSYMSHILKPKKNVYIIQTADGKYAKMQILKYSCGQLTGCYTIKYVYQGNGSRNFY